ncbi:GNAT family N-acetyltransferase [Spongiivirga citrea]|uniref:GNAT family N-acetyltransferase n=1 Tax=Spongiivirga citrea TaxID=1481457 RepID=A0A6M0CGZ4_9FLAO|nr:GNAT family N-acetyltransferase [Spongiivirga citrea]NER17198.1 GNAT family N-acetyltransferase [Spongiivirga citrea]
MIRKASWGDIPTIMSMTKACAKYMQDQGIFQWNEHYPSQKAFENDINRDELWVMVLDGTLVGCIVISTLMDEEYILIQWLTESENSYYIHRLGVHPDYQKKGYAQKMMDFAEDFAKKQGAVSVRLDTFSQNNRNQKFYENRGYQRLGNIFFPKQSEHPFYCYELVLE